SGLRKERRGAAGHLLAHDRLVPLPARLSDRPSHRVSNRGTDQEIRQHRPGVRADGEEGTPHARPVDGTGHGQAGVGRRAPVRHGRSAEAGQKITSREAIVGKQEERRKGKAIARSLDAASAAKGSSVLNLSGPLPEPFSWFRSDSAFASNVPNPNVSDSKRAPAPARD